MLRLAQDAALDGRDEVDLDEALIRALQLGDQPLRLPPHLELVVRVHAADEGALRCGDFTVEVISVSRGAGVLAAGRSLGVLSPAARQALADSLAALPGGDPDTICAQLSFPPLDPATAHVAGAVQILPMAISLAEHRPPQPGVLTVEDLAVGCDSVRMYLAAPGLGRRVDAVTLHALNPRRHTPPLARFLTELCRAQCAQVTSFDWGAAACMPFLPRIRTERVVLSAARWRLPATDLPARDASWSAWDEEFAAWRTRRHLTRRVLLAEDDRGLPLDLDTPAHRMMLRAHLETAPEAIMIETPPPTATGWYGRRPHEVVIPLRAAAPPAWPRLPDPTPARVISRDHGQTPATSHTLLAKIYADPARQDDILAHHLPLLLAEWELAPTWWFLHYRDPEPHLRLRIRLSDPEEFGPTAHRISRWADDLHQRGLVRHVQYATSYSETGRWGTGPALAAAEAVFAADSRAVLIQLGQRQRPHLRVLLAAHAYAITTAFTGSPTAATRWLIDHLPAAAPAPTTRPVFTQAVRLADPAGDWAALRATPGGAAIVDGWKERDQAITGYRTHLPGPHTHGIAVDDVLGGLLHVHAVRAIGIDLKEESACLHLARAAALSLRARTSGNRP